MEKNQELTEEHEALSSTHDELSNRYNSLAVDYESLAEELESLKESYNVVIAEKNSLLAEQSIAPPKDFNLPCIKCIERSNAENSAGSSLQPSRENSTDPKNVTNTSDEEIAALSDENCRLRSLVEDGMPKSLKGHQTLCDLLKKSILNKNPRKEGLGFERKLNVDGTYWTPDQYPRTSWIRAQNEQVDPSSLSGYDSPTPITSDESVESNYKLFKQQNGEVFARFIGTNYSSGPPKKQIWVKKNQIENLPITANLTL
jgi:hypothetical protein